MSAYGRRSATGAGIVLVLFILLVIIIVAASGRYCAALNQPFTTNCPPFISY
ncbi:hypothetical protein [Chengkuizengella marina]|uniref:hypothetical protein n=1 Tax=Chengkuizengella marina TaxID=2507566 RepID=UPI00136AC222|nr:hypothetical protein [Chengkuizengella marina]